MKTEHRCMDCDYAEIFQIDNKAGGLVDRMLLCVRDYPPYPKISPDRTPCDSFVSRAQVTEEMLDGFSEWGALF